MQTLGIRSINVRVKKYLNKLLTWCDRWRIKLNPGKTYLINFSQRKVINDSSITLYDQQLKVTQSVKFLGVHTANHLNIKQEMRSRQKKSAKNVSERYLMFGPNQILVTLRWCDRPSPVHENVCRWFLNRYK